MNRTSGDKPWMLLSSQISSLDAPNTKTMISPPNLDQMTCIGAQIEALIEGNTPLRKREIRLKNAWENRLSVRRGEEGMMLITGESHSFKCYNTHSSSWYHDSSCNGPLSAMIHGINTIDETMQISGRHFGGAVYGGCVMVM